MEPTQRRDPEEPRVEGERAEAIGAYLARQRQLRGVTLDELSAATRIPLRSLRRLETGAFDADPDGFARGFVRTVAVALGLPPDETVARMLPEATGDAGRSVFRGDLGWRALAAGALLAAIGLGILVWTGSRALPVGWTRDRDTLVVRRDAVHALALELGIPVAPAANPTAAPPPPAQTPPEGPASGAAKGGAARSEP